MKLKITILLAMISILTIGLMTGCGNHEEPGSSTDTDIVDKDNNDNDDSDKDKNDNDKDDSDNTAGDDKYKKLTNVEILDTMETLPLYPTKDLFSLYNMPGTITDEFEKDDLGVWEIISKIKTDVVEYENGITYKEHSLTLEFDLNEKETDGYYREYVYDKSASTSSSSSTITYDENGIGFDNDDLELKAKVENFPIFLQTLNLSPETLETLPVKEVENEGPNYSLSYYLDEENTTNLKAAYPTIEITGPLVLEISKTEKGLERFTISNEDGIKELISFSMEFVPAP